MIYLGIDIAKKIHVAAAMSAEGQILITPFSFSNDISGFSLLHEKIASLDKEHLLIGLESTAHYAENVIIYLLNLGYKVTVINPLQTASLRRTSIRKIKTDKADSFLIVKAMILNNCKPVGQRDVDTIMLRSLCKTRQRKIYQGGCHSLESSRPNFRWNRQPRTRPPDSTNHRPD